MRLNFATNTYHYNIEIQNFDLFYYSCNKTSVSLINTNDSLDKEKQKMAERVYK